MLQPKKRQSDSYLGLGQVEDGNNALLDLQFFLKTLRGGKLHKPVLLKCLTRALHLLDTWWEGYEPAACNKQASSAAGPADREQQAWYCGTGPEALREVRVSQCGQDRLHWLSITVQQDYTNSCSHG